MLEAQQRSIDADPASSQIDVIGDAGSLQARRIMERLLTEDRMTKAAE
jgi:hypothetical protein